MKLPNFFFHFFMANIIALLVVSCGGNEPATTKTETGETNAANDAGKTSAMIDSLNSTTIQWLDSTFLNLKDIGEEDSVAVVYRFKNTGDKTLLIKSVTPDCGCTIADTLYKPVMPGANSEIKVKFYAKNQAVATHQKRVYVLANTKPNPGTILAFQVKIVEDKK